MPCRDPILTAALVAIQMPLSALPAPVTRLLLQHSVPTPKLASPTAVRHHICAPGGAATVGAAVVGDVLRAVALLTYCMADIDDGDAASVWTSDWLGCAGFAKPQPNEVTPHLAHRVVQTDELALLLVQRPQDMQ